MGLTVYAPDLSPLVGDPARPPHRFKIRPHTGALLHLRADQASRGSPAGQGFKAAQAFD